MTVDHTVHHVPQSQRMSCWAACTAMVIGWSRSQSYPEDAVLAEFPEFIDGIDEEQGRELARRAGLTYIGEATYTPEGWEQILLRGPAIVDVPEHIIVVAGIAGDGTYEGSQVHVHDPARGERWVAFDNFSLAVGGGSDFDLGILQL